MKMTYSKFSSPLLLLALTSCGTPPPPLEFAEVEGKVVLNNRPVTGVMVRFYPISDKREQLPIASGITDAFGTFSLTHQGDKPGALVGPNRVVVQWPSRDIREAAGSGPPSQAVPLRYTTLLDSPLSIEVKAGARQTVDLRLEE
jgi:hypothetical protein